MKGNYLICKNRVVIEGIDIGQFSDFEVTSERKNIATTATIRMPFYSITMLDPNKDTRDAKVTESQRFDSSKIKIMTGSKIEVYMSYDGSQLGNDFEEILVFSGYVVQVLGAFPTTIRCQDSSFILRYGTVGKDWKAQTTLKDILDICIGISNAAFGKYRKDNGLTGSWTQLSVIKSKTADTEFQLDVWKNISPFDALTRLMRIMCLYCATDKDGGLYAGLGIDDINKETVKLSTKTNVIQCDIVPQNSMFTSYCVKVNGLDAEGKKISGTAGDPKGAENIQLPLSSLKTAGDLEKLANATLDRLKGDKNKGTITTLLYPYCKLFDFLQFTHTLFPELSGNYYVIGTKITGGLGGYRQVLTVTDETFVF